MKRFLAVFLSLIFITSPLQTSAASVETVTYLKNANQSAWTTMALSLSENNLSLNHLDKTYNEAIELAAPILAITAAKQDPTNFSGQNLVSKLKSFIKNNQIGAENMLNDDIFGSLALLSAGEPCANLSDVIDNLKKQQKSNGGFGFSTTSSPDTNITAVAVILFIHCDNNVNAEHIVKAIEYIKSAQNTDGGFAYDPKSLFDSSSDASSTAWVMWMLNKLNISPASWNKNGNDPLTYLSSLKSQTGYYLSKPNSATSSFTPIITAYAHIAITGKSLPLNTNTENNTSHINEFRIEGKDETTCEGKISAKTALELVKKASEKCNFTYTIKDTSFGPYLSKINNDEASGEIGWLYLVNNISPSVGANDYILKEGDEIVWFYGKFDLKPCRITSTTQNTSSGKVIAIKTESFNGSLWEALPNATVHAGASVFTTNTSGNLDMTLPDGFYKAYCDKKDVAFRSAKLGLTYGQGAFAKTSVTATIEGDSQGGGGGQTSVISILVNPQTIDFGTIKKGETKQQKITIQNTGNVNFIVQTEGKGDASIKDNLKIASTNINTYSKEVLPGKNLEETITLSIPQGINEVGKKAAEITFFAVSK